MTATPAFSVWAPDAQQVHLRLHRRGERSEHVLTREAQGWHRLADPVPRDGDRYAFRLGEDGPWLPDPRSRLQPDGVHADSAWVDLGALEHETSWSGRDVRGGVIYELHVGTFTPGPDGRGGTFDSAISALPHLLELGIDAIEVMPVAAFPGDRGWGYDGVGLFSTHAAYGGPAAFARFVSAAHRLGLAVILDVVHNHFGPDGAYQGQFGPYFTDAHHTPWGSAVNLDGPDSRAVRDILLASARQWLVDMHLDGLRLDAVHELHDDSATPFLAELADAVGDWSREIGRPLRLIAESDRNDPRTVTPTDRGGLGMDLQWADDMHHAVHAWITGERSGYYADFGAATTVRKTLTRIFEHDGTWSSFRGRTWGSPVDTSGADYDGHAFVTFLQDHDQVGNRAAGDRIDRSIDARRHAAAISLVLLGAATPMLFQGEEWAASTPFAYFTDHEPELGRLVTEGRTAEFAGMSWTGTVPDPQDRATFEDSMLRWDERQAEASAQMLDWYRTLLRLRREHPALRDPRLDRIRVEAPTDQVVVMHRGPFTLVAQREESADPVGVSTDAELLASFGSVRRSDAGTTLDGPGALLVRHPGQRGQASTSSAPSRTNEDSRESER